MSKNILIVDDNRDLADGLALVLETEDHLTTVCYTGNGAINATGCLFKPFDTKFVLNAINKLLTGDSNQHQCWGG